MTVDVVKGVNGETGNDLQERPAVVDDLRNNFQVVASLVGLEIVDLSFRDRETGRVYK